MSERDEWWLLSNRHGGVHRAPGRTATEARVETRASIAETYRAEGLSDSAAARAAHSYQVRILAGPVAYADVVKAYDAWGHDDFAPAADLARRTGHHRVARALALEEQPDA